MPNSTWLIYGANGYTGDLIAREAVKRGLRPILAGRNRDQVAALATALNLEHRIAALDDRAALEAALRDVTVVAHCAGPFSRTSKPMIDACLRTRVHYLDITGEIAVFEAAAARDLEAKAAGIMVLPGA
ncbi:MAG TPA: saccharopine dehydrogenase NADP-binding domain-containing protein, partial [Anaerolineae bacterium]|nr:saccharopine dehydrogenase NADP-binding domain-containing protein [Anaerolineae bacterium]